MDYAVKAVPIPMLEVLRTVYSVSVKGIKIHLFCIFCIAFCYFFFILFRVDL